MKLFEKVEAPVSKLETFGTVAENVGTKGTITFDVNNLKRDDKLVMVDLTNGNGEKQTVFCSAALSAQIRKDKMAKQDLINYVGGLKIALTTNDDGEQRFKIILEQGLKVGGSITAAPVAKKSEFADMPW